MTATTELIAGRSIRIGHTQSLNDEPYSGWTQPFIWSKEYVLRLKGGPVGEVYPTPYEESWWARLPLHNAKEFDTIHEAMTYIEAIGALID
jgi:hypothetical protein